MFSSTTVSFFFFFFCFFFFVWKKKTIDSFSFCCCLFISRTMNWKVNGKLEITRHVHVIAVWLLTLFLQTSLSYAQASFVVTVYDKTKHNVLSMLREDEEKKIVNIKSDRFFSNTIQLSWNGLRVEYSNFQNTQKKFIFFVANYLR